MKALCKANTARPRRWLRPARDPDVRLDASVICSPPFGTYSRRSCLSPPPIALPPAINLAVSYSVSKGFWADTIMDNSLWTQWAATAFEDDGDPGPPIGTPPTCKCFRRVRSPSGAETSSLWQRSLKGRGLRRSCCCPRRLG